MKKFLKELLPYLIIIIVVVFIRTFIVTPVRVQGSSMFPTLHDGEILILKKYDQSYSRFDIVVLKHNKDKLIKRIIGLPGEHVAYKNNTLYINGEKIEEEFLPEDLEFDDFDTILLGNKIVPENTYLVLGDNRNNSTDSRVIGFIEKDVILGTTNFRIFPFTKFGGISWFYYGIQNVLLVEE